MSRSRETTDEESPIYTPAREGYPNAARNSSNLWLQDQREIRVFKCKPDMQRYRRRKVLLVPESPMQQRGGRPRSSFHHRSCIVVFSWSEVGSLAIEENGSCCCNVIHICRYTFCPRGGSPMNFRPNRIEKKSIWIHSFFFTSDMNGPEVELLLS